MSVIKGTDAVQNNRREAKEVSADIALARGDDVYSHSDQQSDSREESCSTCLHETQGKVGFGYILCSYMLELLY